MITITSNKQFPIAVPRDVAVCPICGNDIFIEEVDEWYAETGEACGVHIDCMSRPPDIDSQDYIGWFRWHWSTPCSDWIPLTDAIVEWFNQHYRIEV